MACTPGRGKKYALGLSGSSKSFQLSPTVRYHRCPVQTKHLWLFLKWFQDYLSNREVCNNGWCLFSRATVTTGILQCSNLGPLLFVEAFNDIFNILLSISSNLTGYADDVTPSRKIACDKDLLIAHSDLSSINTWIEDHGLQSAWSFLGKKTPNSCLDDMRCALEQVSNFYNLQTLHGNSIFGFLYIVPWKEAAVTVCIVTDAVH